MNELAVFAPCQAFGTTVTPNTKLSSEGAISNPPEACGSVGCTQLDALGSPALSRPQARLGALRSSATLWRAKINSCREILIGLVSALLLCANVAHSATYYVSRSGSNANRGTSVAPWATVTYACSKVSPGDTVLVQPGIYSDREVISAVGHPENRITVRANGAVTNKGQWYITGSNVRIDGFEITGGGSFVNGMDSHYIAPGASNIWIVNNYFHDSPGSWDTAVSVDASGWANNVVLSNNYIAHWGAANDAVIVARGWNWDVVNNTISNTFGGDAFRVLGGNNVFRNNRVVQFGSYIVHVGGSANPEFNGFYYYNAALSALHKPPSTPTNRRVNVHTNLAGYMWVMFSDDNQFDAYTAETYGWSNKISICRPDRSITYASAPTTTSSLWVMHNAAMVTPPTGGSGYVNHPDFVQIFGSTVSTNNIFDGNYAEGNTVGAIAQLSCETTQQPPPIGNWTFRNNTFVNLRTASANIQTHWYNNVFYRCGDSSQSAISLTLHNPDNASYRGSAQGSSVKGNLFIACAGGAYNMGWYSVLDSNPYVSENISTNCDYNYVTRDTNTWAKVRQPNNNYPPDSFAWYEPNGINGGDPKLPFISQLEFRAVAGSKLIDAGPTLPAVRSDADGVARTMGAAPDIGPFEVDPTLKARWTFDEDISDGTLTDWTGNGHTAYNGNPTNWIKTGTGPSGNAGVWSQVGTMTNAPPQTYVLSQYAYVTNLTGMEFLTNGTISLWVQWGAYTNDYTGATRNATLLDSGGTTIPSASPPSLATNSWRLAYGPASSTLPAVGPVFSAYSESANYPSNFIQFTHSRDNATWHHITMTWEANGKVIGYENGAPFATNAFPRPYLRIAGRNPLSPPFGASEAIPWLSIGASSHGGSLTWGDDRFPNDGFFVGKMDDIRIYSRALSPNEIAGLYGHVANTDSPVLPPPDGIVKAPAISVDLTNVTAVAGSSVRLEVVATGTAPLTYSWTRNGLPISGTTAALIMGSVQPADAGTYQVSVSNSGGAAVSTSVRLAVLEVPSPPSRLRTATTSDPLALGVQ